jgi:hypothetical protein
VSNKNADSKSVVAVRTPEAWTGVRASIDSRPEFLGPQLYSHIQTQLKTGMKKLTDIGEDLLKCSHWPAWHRSAGRVSQNTRRNRDR